MIKCSLNFIFHQEYKYHVSYNKIISSLSTCYIFYRLVFRHCLGRMVEEIIHMLQQAMLRSGLRQKRQLEQASSQQRQCEPPRRQFLIKILEQEIKIDTFKFKETHDMTTKWVLKQAKQWGSEDSAHRALWSNQ